MWDCQNVCSSSEHLLFFAGGSYVYCLALDRWEQNAIEWGFVISCRQGRSLMIALKHVPIAFHII